MTRAKPRKGRQKAAGNARRGLGRGTLLVLVACGFLTGALVAATMLPGVRERVAPSPTSVGKALVGGPFSLVDHAGRRVRDTDFRGRYMLILFGYTWCPDICPSGLQVMATALDMLGAQGDRIVPIFVSVDPERDTPAKLAEYVPSFHPRLVGLTGTKEDVAAAARGYRVYYKKVADDKSSAAYTVDHSGFVYLMSPTGEYVAHFDHGTPAADIAARIAKLL